jgi:hypothetical protein
MSLLISDHLQPVLDGAQEAIGCGKVIAGCAVDPFALGKRVEGDKRLADTQFGVAAAGDELLGLYEEFYLADAAAPEFDVMALDRNFVVPAISVDLALHRFDVGHGSKIEIFAPDERREFVQEGFARRDIAGTCAGLYHGRAFPVLAHRAVVVECGGQRDYRLGRRRSGRNRKSTRNT